MRRSLQTLLVLLAAAGAGACKDGPTEGGGGKKGVSVGDQLTFNANSNSACEAPDTRTGRVVAVTQRAVVVADVANPAGGFTDAEYEAFGRQFDTFVYPAVTAAFGEPADIDKNGRVVIFFTRAVNDLTQDGSGEYVGGFFFARDLFPANATQQQQTPGLGLCAGSNFAEMFYMRVPDPSRPANVWGKNAVTQTTVGVIGHEFQHLISASRRLFIIKTTGQNYNEETWLNEGLSHIAEEILFYQASGLQPRQNIDIQRLTATDQVRDAANTYQLSNFGRYIRYLENPETNAPYAEAENDDLATRGATWAFLRYLADRRNGSDNELWRKLVDADLLGMANLRAAVGEPMPFFQDWSVSVYTDDAVPTDARYQQPSWNFRSVIPPIHPSKVFPLKVRHLVGGAPQTVTLKSGGSAYLRFAVPPAVQAQVRVDGTATACQQTLTLQVGQVATTDRAGAGLLCVNGGAAGSEYTLVLFHASPVPGSATTSATVTASGIGPVIGPPTPSRSAFDVTALSLPESPLAHRDVDFEAGLRERERALARLVPGGGAAPSYSRGTAAVGELAVSIVRTK